VKRNELIDARINKDNEKAIDHMR